MRIASCKPRKALQKRVTRGGRDSALATIYDFKPQFQRLLRPIAAALVKRGLSANDVTLGALVLSVAQGAWLALEPGSRWPLLALPVTLFLRMAMNAIDGLMAKEHGQATPAGAVLNEASDVVADAALYLPFALIPGVNAALVVLVVVAGIIAEMAGALGPMIGVKRCYAGPFGKSDRALAFGLLAVMIGVGVAPGLWSTLYLSALLVLSALTVLNRPPKERERKKFVDFLQSDKKSDGLVEEAIWVLMNTAEFRFNH